MSMDLTEPDAGSDLQSVMLKASYNEADGCWYLNGVKRFITNGDADIHLVLARSEEGTKDGRGLSMFIYDKRNGGVNVRRIENKMGIKGSPTCELVFKNAKAELCGDRKLGLIKYVMALMNGARLGIMAQAVGLSEAAYREAYAYALDRKQFGKSIIEFPAIAEIIALMRAKADASRSMLYETARFVDVYKALDDISKERKLTPEERQEFKKYSKLADAFTPMGKGMTTEYANQNAYDAIQVHGGSGFMKDYACERIYRDARITNIYEGTTQLQVVAAIGGVMQRVLDRHFDELFGKVKAEGLYGRLKSMVRDMHEKQLAAVKFVAEKKDAEYQNLRARNLVENETFILVSLLMLRDAQKDAKREALTERYILDAVHDFERNNQIILSNDLTTIDRHREVIDY